MKMKIEIDCTPQEARAFLGLPDVTPLHDVMMDRMRGQLDQNMALLDPETLARAWFPIGAQGMEAMQAFMMRAMQGGDRAPGKAQRMTTKDSESA